jgi:hypothetical protein
VLILTPPPDRAGTAALQSIISLAKQEHIRVYVWMVSSPAYFTTGGAAQLVELAEQTGGQFFAYSGDENIPDIESYLEPLRYIYSINYKSRIVSGNTHQITAHIETEGLDLTTEPQSFDFNILPPNPIFVSPPLNIFRADKTPIGDALTEKMNYTPTEQSVEILIEFPDGRARPLARTTLYVDGSIAAENTAPPFDKFTWRLEDYTSSGTHLLQVEALDSLGLSGVSIETTVQVTVQQTPQSVAATIAKNGNLVFKKLKLQGQDLTPLMGEYVTAPVSTACNISAITLRWTVENYEPQTMSDAIRIDISADGGLTWKTDCINGTTYTAPDDFSVGIEIQFTINHSSQILIINHTLYLDIINKNFIQ